jgi:hypothetical protein
VVTGAADEVMEASAFAAEDQDAVTREVELVIIGLAALVETDDPDVLPLQVFKGTDEVDDAGDAEVFGGAGAGFDGNRTDGSGAAFGEDYAVDASAVGYAEQRAEVLRVFDAIESEQQSACAWFVRFRISAVGLEEIFDGEELGGADEGDYALVGGRLGELGQLLAGLVADADTGLAAEGDELVEPGILALVGDEDVIEAAAAGLDRFFDRMHAIKDFHRDSVEDWWRTVGGEARPIGLIHAG